MPKKTRPWAPKTKFKETLRRLTQGWGVQTRVAEEVGIPKGSLNNWAQTDNNTLPNVEQAYFIAQALDQDLMDMLGGQPQPRTERMDPDEESLLAVYRKLPTTQKRILRQTAETFAAAAGITSAVTDSDKHEQAG